MGDLDSLAGRINDEVISPLVAKKDAAITLLRWLHAEAAYERDRLARDLGWTQAELSLYDPLTDQECENGHPDHPKWLVDSADTHACPWCEIDRLRREVEFEANADPLTGHEAMSRDNLRYPLCACISDDQASQLGPGFSRPVCAGHPEVQP